MTKEQIKFVKEHHKEMSIREVGKKLDINHNTIFYQAKKHGIIFNRYYDNANIGQFKNITNPKIAYFLGFCWADSTINYQEKDKNRPCAIALELVKDDCDYVESVVKNLFKYSSYERQRPDRQPQKTIAIHDVKLAEFLVKEMEFGEKSFKLPTKLLELIPKNLHNHFWLGFSDGDGYLANRFQVGGNYDFDWLIFINLLISLGINSHVYRKYVNPNNGNKFSSITLKVRDTDIFLNYIYQNYEKDKIALPRKYEKYLKRKCHKSL